MVRLSVAVVSRVLVVSLIVAFVAAMLPTPAVADHSWGNYHWARTSNPFTLLAGDNVHSGWDAYLDEAIVDWNASNVVQLKEDTGGTNPRRCNPTSGRIEVCAYKYGRNGWLGLASIWASGDHITQATAKMNDTYFETATYNTPAWRRLVMCQELAHDWGLAHQDENHNNVNLGSCMDYTSDPDGTKANPDQLSNEHPNAHDFDQTETIYTHLDTTTTVKATTTAGASGVEITDPSGPERGGVSVFVTDLGGGNRVITFVIWADANLMAATHANPNAPVSNTTSEEDGIPVDGGTHDHEDGTHDHETTDAETGTAGFTEGSTVVTVDSVNLRAAPSRQADVVAELAVGTTLTVTGPAEESQGLLWVPVVTAEGLTGYVAAEYLLGT